MGKRGWEREMSTLNLRPHFPNGRLGSFCAEPPSTEWLRKRIEIPSRAYLWGVTYWVRPRLLTEVFGNGRQLIFIEPLNTRPEYFVVRVGDDYDLDNYSTQPTGEPLTEHLDEIYTALEDQFGRADADQDDDEDADLLNFPAVDLSVGCSWGGHDWPLDRKQLRFPFFRR